MIGVAGRHPLSQADGHSANGLPAARAVRGRTGLSLRPHGGGPGRPCSRDSQRRPETVVGCDVHVVAAARQVLVRAARALMRDVVGVWRDLPGVVYDRPVWGRDGARGRAYPRGRDPDGSRRIREVVPRWTPKTGQYDQLVIRRGFRRATTPLAVQNHYGSSTAAELALGIDLPDPT